MIFKRMNISGYVTGRYAEFGHWFEGYIPTVETMTLTMFLKYIDLLTDLAAWVLAAVCELLVEACGI